MNPLKLFVLCAFGLLAQPIGAQVTPEEPSGSSSQPEGGVALPGVSAEADDGRLDVMAGPGPYQAEDVPWEDLLYSRRALVIFADSADDPNYQRQLLLLNRDMEALDQRRVIVILDTDPSELSDWRKRLRPRGFSLVLLDTDMRAVFRKPTPWDLREIGRSIDRLPSRRQDLAEEFPGR